ncbi:hypothetical protein BH23ACT3_BH23ACT3_04980 [soil metagenome]
MLAANIWHWWIGVALTGVGVLAVFGLGATYLKSISAQRFPPDERGRRRARENDL